MEMLEVSPAFGITEGHIGFRTIGAETLSPMVLWMMFLMNVWAAFGMNNPSILLIVPYCWTELQPL